MLFQHVIEHELYHHHFQPIIDFNQSEAYGYECLLRSKHVKSPYELFCNAINYNCLLKLDISSFKKAIHSVSEKLNEINGNQHVFTNIYPSTFISTKFMDKLLHLIDKSVISPNQIVLEISESEDINNYIKLKDIIKDVKRLGVKIALDDMDKGNAPLRNILELDPDYVKFDKYFSDNLNKSSKKQSLLKSLLDYCQNNNIKTILEGIEEESDLHVAKSIGIDYGQGYLLGKPSNKLIQSLKKF